MHRRAPSNMFHENTILTRPLPWSKMSRLPKQVQVLIDRLVEVRTPEDDRDIVNVLNYTTATLNSSRFFSQLRR